VTSSTALERVVVGMRRALGAADLADVLECRGADLIVTRRWLKVVERSDVSAHAPIVAGSRSTSRRRTIPKSFPAEQHIEPAPAVAR
jgi:hypothetical protein